MPITNTHSPVPSQDQQRVADWLHARIPHIGAGSDPIGFVLASYAFLHAQLQAQRAQITAVSLHCEQLAQRIEHDSVNSPVSVKEIKEFLHRIKLCLQSDT